MNLNPFRRRSSLNDVVILLKVVACCIDMGRELEREEKRPRLISCDEESTEDLRAENRRLRMKLRAHGIDPYFD